MNLINTIKEVLRKEQEVGKKAMVDLQLDNGNILLKSFHLTHWDENTKTVTGLTMNEEYAYLREEREPVYCIFNVIEIKKIIVLEYTSILLPSIEM